MTIAKTIKHYSYMLKVLMFDRKKNNGKNNIKIRLERKEEEEEAAEEFDKQFSPKEKLKLPEQLF